MLFIKEISFSLDCEERSNEADNQTFRFDSLVPPRNDEAQFLLN